MDGAGQQLDTRGGGTVRTRDPRHKQACREVWEARGPWVQGHREATLSAGLGKGCAGTRAAWASGSGDFEVPPL